MFELGLDQAHGLRQMFMPLISGRVNVIGINPDNNFANAVVNIGQALIAHGFEVQWEDPDDLLPGELPESADSDGAQIVLAAGRETPTRGHDGAYPEYSIFAAQPNADQLTELYAAMKAITKGDGPDSEPRPFTVMWCDTDSSRSMSRSVCESNLTEAVERFLFRTVEYIDPQHFASRTQVNAEQVLDSSRHPFIERLSSALLSGLGQVNRLQASIAN